MDAARGVRKEGNALVRELEEKLTKHETKLSSEQKDFLKKIINDLKHECGKDCPAVEELRKIKELWGNSAEHKAVQQLEYKNVLKVSSHEQYLQLIAKAAGENKLVLVDFFAVWCGPCVRISPKFAELSEEYTNVMFLKVDVDELKTTSESVGVTCMPTFKFYKNGEVVKTIEGADVGELVSSIKQLQI